MRLVTLDALLGVFGYAAGEPDVVVPVVEAGDAGGRRGHPVLLSHRLTAEVLALGPDDPLRDVVHADGVLEAPVDDPGILLDVDRPEDRAEARPLRGQARRCRKGAGRHERGRGAPVSRGLRASLPDRAT